MMDTLDFENIGAGRITQVLESKGGRLWEKYAISRVYLHDWVIEEISGIKGVRDGFFCLNKMEFTGTFESSEDEKTFHEKLDDLFIGEESNVLEEEQGDGFEWGESKYGLTKNRFDRLTIWSGADSRREILLYIRKIRKELWEKIEDEYCGFDINKSLMKIRVISRETKEDRITCIFEVNLLLGQFHAL